MKTIFSTTIQKQINLNLITPMETSFFLLQMGTHVQQMSYSFKVPVYKFVTLVSVCLWALIDLKKIKIWNFLIV